MPAATALRTLILCAAVLLMAVSGHAADGADPAKPAAPSKRKIAILAFEAINDGAKQDNKGRMVSEIFTTAAVNSGIFEVVERHLIEKVLEEMEFGKGAISGTVAQKIGALVGADAVLSGSVAQMLDELRIDSRLINVADGKILLASEDSAKVTLSSIADAAKRSMRKMVAALDPEAATRLQAQAQQQPQQQVQQAPAAPAPPAPAPAPTAPVQSSTNGRYSKDASGVLTDSQTGLQWYPSSGGYYNWERAKSWVRSLNVGGGGWRMPSHSELAGLRTEKQGNCFIDPIFPKLDDGYCGWVWSGETRDSVSVWLFSFHSGKEFYDHRATIGRGDSRVFAVRSRR